MLNELMMFDIVKIKNHLINIKWPPQTHRWHNMAMAFIFLSFFLIFSLYFYFSFKMLSNEIIRKPNGKMQ